MVHVTHSIAKVFLGSAKARWAILTERPTSFWAYWLRDEAKSFQGIQGVRLKLASIAKIKNANTLQRIKYLTREEVRTDQAV